MGEMREEEHTLIVSIHRSQLQESGVFGGSERFIDLLHTMSQELDGLKAEFLKAVETSCKYYSCIIVLVQMYKTLTMGCSLFQQCNRITSYE